MLNRSGEMRPPDQEPQFLWFLVPASWQLQSVE